MMRDADDIAVNHSGNKPFSTVFEARITRRKFSLLTFSTLAFPAKVIATSSPPKQGFHNFREIEAKQNNTVSLSEGYEWYKIISFGDPLEESLDGFDSKKIGSFDSDRRFGGNCDFIHFFADSLDSGILCCNNEFPEYCENPDKKELLKAAYYSVGCSIFHLIKDENERWKIDTKSSLNRRITPATKGVLTGPAVGSRRLKTSLSDGFQTAGTLGNCAGGFTPWGTYLTAEENVQDYFSGDVKNSKESDNHKRFGLNGKKGQEFHKVDKRFDLNTKAAAPLHFGYIVEIDPRKPNSVIRKHTALGRFKHESATCFLAKDGRVVVYSGDDQAFEYLYKFVSRDQYNSEKDGVSQGLLENGTLYVARFSQTEVVWQPLVYGHGPLTKENGFYSQADISLDTRKAADLMEATPMDRPEDIDIHWRTGEVYVALTGNWSRKGSQVNVANPTPRGAGHIITIDAEHGETVQKWDFLVRCGRYMNDSKQGTFSEATTYSGHFIYPDNLTFDRSGGLWVCSDGYGFPGFKDGFWHIKTEGEERGLSRRLASPPEGAEFTGPHFTENNETLFLSVQHPKGKGFPDNGKRSRSTIIALKKR